MEDIIKMMKEQDNKRYSAVEEALGAFVKEQSSVNEELRKQIYTLKNALHQEKLRTGRATTEEVKPKKVVKAKKKDLN